MTAPFRVSKVFEQNWTWKPGVDLIVNRGGTSCFYGDQKVKTFFGSKAIKDLKPGELVKTYDHKLDEVCYRPVIKLHKFENTKPTLEVRLKNGEVIRATEDHKFWFDGRWVSLKYIVSLLDGDMEEDTRI